MKNSNFNGQVKRYIYFWTETIITYTSCMKYIMYEICKCLLWILCDLLGLKNKFKIISTTPDSYMFEKGIIMIKNDLF